MYLLALEKYLPPSKIPLKDNLPIEWKLKRRIESRTEFEKDVAEDRDHKKYA